jgi:hypothetical protein
MGPLFFMISATHKHKWAHKFYNGATYKLKWAHYFL